MLSFLLSVIICWLSSSPFFLLLIDLRFVDASPSKQKIKQDMFDVFDGDTEEQKIMLVTLSFLVLLHLTFLVAESRFKLNLKAVLFIQVYTFVYFVFLY